MRISVIVINFNYAHFVERAISSVLHQAEAECELIVVDDGSTDDSWVRINRWVPRIKAVQVPHQGQIAAAMAGFAVSQGQVTVFLDADDELAPLALSNICRAFIDQPLASKVQGYLEAIDREGRPLGWRLPHRLPPTGDYSQWVISRGLSAMPHAFSSGNAWSSAFLSQVFPLPLDGWLDDYLHDLAPLYGHIISLDTIVARYRIHGANSWYGTRRFDAPSLGMFAEKIIRKTHFLADHLEQCGYHVARADWLRWKRSWRDHVIVFAAAEMGWPIQRGAILPMIMSPFRTNHLNPLQALLLTGALIMVRLLPSSAGLRLAKYLLQRNGDWH